MPEPLAGLEGPVRPEEPCDEAGPGRVSACSETEVLSRVEKMLVEKNSARATSETTIALLGVKERPEGRVDLVLALHPRHHYL